MYCRLRTRASETGGERKRERGGESEKDRERDGGERKRERGKEREKERRKRERQTENVLTIRNCGS